MDVPVAGDKGEDPGVPDVQRVLQFFPLQLYQQNPHVQKNRPSHPLPWPGVPRRWNWVSQKGLLRSRSLQSNKKTNQYSSQKYQFPAYYEKNMTPPCPILLTVEQYQYLDNRNRKILKLCIMKEKSQAQGQKEKRKSFVHSNGLKTSNLSAIADILPKLEESNLENIADS